MFLVDTSVWSLALRRDRPASDRHVRRFQTALADGEVLLTGIVLQEVLQGLNDGEAKERLSTHLSKLRLLVPSRDDHVVAAQTFTALRRNGLQIGTVDALLAALCIRRDLTLLTADRDFSHASKHVPLDVWPSRRTSNRRRQANPDG